MIQIHDVYAYVRVPKIFIQCWCILDTSRLWYVKLREKRKQCLEEERKRELNTKNVHIEEEYVTT